ncbi:MAG: selenide, water dikinase SelD [Chitinispirillaceae bacterium]|nr:selenide, water dikinase SelD [Chitinispirillaceae bacterium]
MAFDLLSTVTYGGCSAKIPAGQLAAALSHLSQPHDERLLVDISTHDDAGVFRISEDIALIQTTDFFPPVCSDPRTFGKIAAANSLSDIYAMGGSALTALNIVCFPSTRIPLEVLAEILAGGQEKVTEAGAVITGGHTIDDFPPKYGLAVTGVVHPGRIITNAAARAGDRLILTKPLGVGVIIAGKRLGEVNDADYAAALDAMQQLNKTGAEIMQRYNIRCATDVTGFGLLGHAFKMAEASGVSFRFDNTAVPLLSGAYELTETGCIPGACFRNQEFVETQLIVEKGVDYNRKMLMLDAQTSGGLLICVPEEADANAMLDELHHTGYSAATQIGSVEPGGASSILVE